MNTYFKFLFRNKLYTLIEIFGLSIALGFIILAGSYARTEFSVGGKQQMSKQLYAVGMGEEVGMTLATAENLFPSVPEITSWTRIAYYGKTDITVDGEYYEVRTDAVDTNFLHFFNYELTGCGKEKILTDKNDVIVSRKFASKAFGNDDPVGRTIELSGKKLTVVGVIQDFGPYDELKYADIFLNMSWVYGMYRPMDNFGMVQTFVTLADGAVPETVAERLLDKYVDYWDFYSRDGSDGSFLWGSTLTRLDKLYFSELNAYAPLRKGDKKTVEMLLAVVLILLLCAVFNYVNLTVALTGKRAKEMATRRLLGESSGAVVRRYLAESFLFTFGCFAIGCVIAVAFRQWMNGILSADIVLLPDWQWTVIVVVFLSAVSLISGILPAFMISKFKPIDVVKGEYRFKSKMIFSKIFIVCQNAFSTLLVALALTMTLQMRYLDTLPTGYNTDDIIYISSWSLGFRNMAAQNALADRISACPQVEAVGKGMAMPFSCGSNGVHLKDENLSWMKVSYLDSVAFRILGFKVLERWSDPVAGTTWVTEETKSRYGVSEENRNIGDAEANQFECCGVIADFRANDALDKPMPDSHNAVTNRYEVCSQMIVKISGDRQTAAESVRNAWTSVAIEFLGVPKEADMSYVDDLLNDSLSGTRNTMMLVLLFMALSIIISALGLLAMSIYFTEQQARKIALQKIFGAGVNESAWKLSRTFMIMSAVAVVLAMPFAVWTMKYYLADFYNAIPFPWIVLPVTAVVILLIAFLSIWYQTDHSAKRNPVEVLKDE